MAFTAGELANLANALLDHYIKGPAIEQTKQDKPLFDRMTKSNKTFAASQKYIRGNVKGVYTSRPAGYTHNDTVTYTNPANLVQYQYQWYELHQGMSVTLTELKAAGISVVDSMDGAETRNHPGRDVEVITDLMQDKINDMMEGWAIGYNALLWGDGTADAKAFPGIRAFVVDSPATGVVGGIDAATNSWWRNRSNIASAVASGADLIEFLHQEIRQLRRYGGRPDVALAGSDFLDRLIKEVRAKGVYSESGFNKAFDISIGEIKYQGITFVYDPTLDDLQTAGTVTNAKKRCYILDTSKMGLWYMAGEKLKKHTPARPPEKYVMYRGLTDTVGMVCQQRNCHGVYAIA
jgi:hypothetical protein